MSPAHSGAESKPAVLRGLYAITDSRLLAPERLIEGVEQAIRGGATLIQYRDKSQDTARRVREARALAELCASYNTRLLINDDVMLARAVGAHGVHLGRTDGGLAEARALLGAEAIIGSSCYASLELALSAQSAGADYVAFGAFFPSHTKPHAVRATPELLQRARARLSIPIAAIGGITPVNGAALIEAGAELLAVVQGVFGAADVYAAARSYTRLFQHPSGQEDEVA